MKIPEGEYGVYTHKDLEGEYCAKAYEPTRGFMYVTHMFTVGLESLTLSDPTSCGWNSMDSVNYVMPWEFLT